MDATTWAFLAGVAITLIVVLVLFLKIMCSGGKEDLSKYEN
jgi:hypothetical protein